MFPGYATVSYYLQFNTIEDTGYLREGTSSLLSRTSDECPACFKTSEFPYVLLLETSNNFIIRKFMTFKLIVFKFTFLS